MNDLLGGGSVLLNCLSSGSSSHINLSPQGSVDIDLLFPWHQSHLEEMNKIKVRWASHPGREVMLMTWVTLPNLRGREFSQVNWLLILQLVHFNYIVCWETFLDVTTPFKLSIFGRHVYRFMLNFDAVGVWFQTHKSSFYQLYLQVESTFTLLQVKLSNSFSMGVHGALLRWHQNHYF